MKPAILMGKYEETRGGLIAARWKVGRLNANSEQPS
jgi:hypothetical protein